MDYGSVFSCYFGSGSKAVTKKMSAAIIANPPVAAQPGNSFRTGAWVVIAGVVMLFTALTSAYIVRSASANDWRPIAMPKVLWLSTALIILSSLTMEVSRRSLKQQRE